ncbi:hypothetical protein N1851_024993 [Merluccius polli]|uniref:Uncharacterized protein n=1 Tax=Merluccius polli TaxID=89951 RepID=A0AA47NV46_MERPO|nr:hypothetical protein N1851_024993 [Merluccius polli]
MAEGTEYADGYNMEDWDFDEVMVETGVRGYLYEPQYSDEQSYRENRVTTLPLTPMEKNGGRYFRVVETPIVPNKGRSSVDFNGSSRTITGTKLCWRCLLLAVAGASSGGCWCLTDGCREMLLLHVLDDSEDLIRWLIKCTLFEFFQLQQNSILMCIICILHKCMLARLTEYGAEDTLHNVSSQMVQNTGICFCEGSLLGGHSCHQAVLRELAREDKFVTLAQQIFLDLHSGDEQLRAMEEQEAAEAAAATAEAGDLPAADEEPAMARARADWWYLCSHRCQFLLDEIKESEDDTDVCVVDHPSFAPHMDSGVLETYFRIPKVNWKRQPKPTGPNGRLSVKLSARDTQLQTASTAGTKKRRTLRTIYSFIPCGEKWSEAEVTTAKQLSGAVA